METLSKPGSALDQAAVVKGQLSFVQRSSEEQPSFEGPAGFGAPPVVDREVTIRTARPIVDSLSLDREGFTLIKHETPYTSAPNPESWGTKYLEELNAVIKDRFKASWITNYQQGVVGSVILRYPGGINGMQPLSRLTHIDFSPVAAPVVAAISDQEHGRPIRAYSRMMLIQTWRALSPPPQDFPLALCDGSSIVDTDLVDATFSRDGIVHKSWLVHYSPLHRWYYFPELTQDELILFKGYDSLDKYNPRSAHTAFDNRRAHPHANPRMSIETRHFVYYD